MTSEDPLSSRFRIVTNGIRFRVERLDWVGMLWWKRQKWLPRCSLHLRENGVVSAYVRLTPMEFPTIESAQVQLYNDVRELKAEIHGWQTVSSKEA